MDRATERTETLHRLWGGQVKRKAMSYAVPPQFGACPTPRCTRPIGHDGDHNAPKGGRPKLENHWRNRETVRLLGMASVEVTSAKLSIEAASSLDELAKAEIDLDKALHRVREAMQRERNMEALNK